MKNKKIIIIIAIILVIICATIFGIYRATHNPNYLYNEDGTISDGHAELIKSIKDLQDKEEREKKIKFSLDYNLITQEEANELY